MMTMKKQLILAALGFTVMSTVACGEDVEPVDPQTTRQAITQNVDNLADTLRDAALFLEQSELFNSAFRASFRGASAQGDCVGLPDNGFECTEVPMEPEPFDSAVVDGPAADLIEFLTTRVFTDANVESSAQGEVTFLLRGQNVCAGVNAEGFEQCKTTLDNAQLRIKVSAPAAGDLDMDLMVGPTRAKPLALNLWRNKLAAEVDLAALKVAIGHIAGAAGEQAPELPATMQGKFKASLERLAADKLRAQLGVTQAIQIADGADTDIQIAQANPALQGILDGASKTLTVAVDWKAVKIKAPSTTEIWDAEVPRDPNDPDAGFEPSEPRQVRHVIELALGGASGTSVLDGVADSVTLQNVGLGDATTRVKIDGVQALALDLNAAAGRRFNALITQQADGVKVELDPSFSLALAFTFAQIANKDGLDYKAWMDNDTLSIIADGAAKPAVLLGDQLKVLAGKLTFKSTGRAVTIEANAGQCVLTEGQSAAPCPADGMCEDPAPNGDDHPFAGMSAGVCQ
jgi:hypothetical protein